jgi:hypothetical protein
MNADTAGFLFVPPHKATYERKTGRTDAQSTTGGRATQRIVSLRASMREEADQKVRVST